MHHGDSGIRRTHGEIPARVALIGVVLALAFAAPLPYRSAQAAAASEPAAAPRAAPEPAASGDGAATEAAASSPTDGPAPVEVSLKSRDGHAFAGLYMAPSSSASNAILVVPDLGQKRDHFLRLVKSLHSRGYRVLSMDNTGQLRQVVRRPNAIPTFTTMTTEILGEITEDVSSGLAGLRAQTGVGRVAILGFGIGANAGLLVGGADATVAAVGTILPNYGCAGFNPYEAFGDMNARPVLLLESRKRYQSDIATAFEHIKAKRKDLPLEHVMLRRDPEATTQQDLEENYEESVLAWLEKAFPNSSH